MTDKLRHINLNLLVSLHLLLQARSVTQAALRQHITQSAMSKNLAKLRQVFNDPLLLKNGNELLLTDKAQALAPEVANLVQRLDLLFSPEQFSPADCRQEFTIAATDYVSEYILPKPLAQIYQDAPHISIDVTHWDQHTYQALKQGDVDLGTTVQDHQLADIHASHINRDHYVCIMRQTHPLAQQARLSLNEFTAYHHALITTGADKAQAIDKALHQVGHHRKIRLRVSSYPSALNMVAQTDLLLTLPAHIAERLAQEHQVVIKPLPIAVPEFDCTLQWHHRNHQDPAHRWFRQRLYELIKQQGQ